jgi:GNAT superfamily N-acetyltransferase
MNGRAAPRHEPPRRAEPEEAGLLSQIARRAKAHWGYADEILASWSAELTVEAADLALHPSFVLEMAGAVAGFAILRVGVPYCGLDALWIDPQWMGRGLGRLLLARSLKESWAHRARGLAIDADPHAERFYARCGAVRVGHEAAPIPGEPARVRAQMVLERWVAPEDRIGLEPRARLHEDEEG